MLRDEFDDFIDKIKKRFQLDSDMFEIDFLFLPESEIKRGKAPDNEKIKGFKISYHFESGMEKPEVKIEGNVDSKKVWEYLKGADLSKLPNVRELYDSKSNKEIDVNTLSLEAFEEKSENNELIIVEPYTEVCNNEDSTEILIEIPGIDKEDVNVRFGDKGRKLVFRAGNLSRKYVTTIHLPFQSSKENCKLEVNNGVAIINVRNST
jgi:HSP20 family molecular chaperone IbpA